MKFYKKGFYEEFFENKRFSEENLPTLGEVSEIIEDIFNKRVVRNFERKLTLAEWNFISRFICFKDTNKNLPSCRSIAYANNAELLNYIKNEKIYCFEDFMYNENETLLEATKKVNVETYSSLYEYFKTGEHIGNCGTTSKLIGIMFNNPNYIVKGNSILLKGSENSPNGEHSWIEAKINNSEYIIDTSLLLVIPKELEEKLGYKAIKKVNKEDMLKYYDREGILHCHYCELSKKTTENKASYNAYLTNLLKELSKEKTRDE
jgi:hypothetical protein